MTSELQVSVSLVFLPHFREGGPLTKQMKKGLSIKVVTFSAQFHQKSVERVRLVTYVPENAP